MNKVFAAIVLSLFSLVSTLPATAQDDSPNLTLQSFKWFPEGDYSGLTSLNIDAAKSKPEMELFRKYWSANDNYDPFDNFLPAPLNKYKYKAFGNAARYKIKKPTAAGLKKIKERKYRGGDLQEFAGEHYFIKNDGFEITVCLYDNPDELIAQALADKQIALQQETLFGLKIYKTTPAGAKMRRQVLFAATGTGEIVIADDMTVLEAMLEAGMGSENLAEDKSYGFLWEMMKDKDFFWMFNDVTTSVKIDLELAKEAGDQKKVELYQGYLDEANNQLARYFSLQKNSLRRGYIYLFPSEKRAREVYLKFKEWEGIDPSQYDPKEQDQNIYLTALGTRHQLDGCIYRQYRDLDAEFINKKMEEAERLRGKATQKSSK